MIASAIWLPTVYTGHSALIGSWNTIAIFPPAHGAQPRVLVPVFGDRDRALRAVEQHRARA